MTMITYRDPQKKLWVEFSLHVARAVFMQEPDLLMSTGGVSEALNFEYGFILSVELDHIIQAALKALGKSSQTELIIETEGYGAFFVRATKMEDVNYGYKTEPSTHIEIETYESRVNTFRQIAYELADIQAAYAN